MAPTSYICTDPGNHHQRKLCHQAHQIHFLIREIHIQSKVNKKDTLTFDYGGFGLDKNMFGDK